MRLSNAALAFLLVATSSDASVPRVYTASWYSQVYAIDAIYKSMEGPASEASRVPRAPSEARDERSEGPSGSCIFRISDALSFFSSLCLL